MLTRWRTEGERAQAGLTSSSCACEDGDGPNTSAQHNLAPKLLVELQTAIGNVIGDLEREAGLRGNRGRALAESGALTTLRIGYEAYHLDVTGSGLSSYVVLVRVEPPREASCRG